VLPEKIDRPNAADNVKDNLPWMPAAEHEFLDEGHDTSFLRILSNTYLDVAPARRSRL
jgi:hypothetical protein